MESIPNFRLPKIDAGPACTFPNNEYMMNTQVSNQLNLFIINWRLCLSAPPVQFLLWLWYWASCFAALRLFFSALALHTYTFWVLSGSWFPLISNSVWFPTLIINAYVWWWALGMPMHEVWSEWGILIFFIMEEHGKNLGTRSRFVCYLILVIFWVLY